MMNEEREWLAATKQLSHCKWDVAGVYHNDGKSGRGGDRYISWLCLHYRTVIVPTKIWAKLTLKDVDFRFN